VHRSLGPLTGKALASPLIDLLRHAGPDKTGGDEATCSPYTRLPGIVQPVKNAAAKRQWHQWPEEGGGHITKQVLRPDQPTNNIKSWRLPHESDLRTSALSCGEGGQVRNSGDEGLGGGEVSAAAGVGKKVAEGEAAGAEVACSAGAAFGGGGGDGADHDPGRLSASATACWHQGYAEYQWCIR
jgi:hypothetical protein